MSISPASSTIKWKHTRPRRAKKRAERTAAIALRPKGGSPTEATDATCTSQAANAEDEVGKIAGAAKVVATEGAIEKSPRLVALCCTRPHFALLRNCTEDHHCCDTSNSCARRSRIKPAHGGSSTMDTWSKPTCHASSATRTPLLKARQAPEDHKGSAQRVTRRAPTNFEDKSTSSAGLRRIALTRRKISSARRARASTAWFCSRAEAEQHMVCRSGEEVTGKASQKASPIRNSAQLGAGNQEGVDLSRAEAYVKSPPTKAAVEICNCEDISQGEVGCDAG
mmetsp:Transcript_90164/g.291446  ORF Transcript_90164/g.291446 Transcript_90164/m.291446 type:complete len:281 (+) Transcript_90164:1011-1853(+)